jgi:glutaminyl-peptide cyclotransferase
MPVSPDTRAATMLDRRTKRGIFLGVAVVAAAIAALAWWSRAGAIIPAAQNQARQMRVEVIASYPHDRGAFTQGLLYHEGVLYESTGLEGESTLRRVDLKTGRVLQTVALASNFFAEGLALAPQGLIQLTWQNDTGFVYDPASLVLRRQFKYAGDGWGLCYDGTSLAMTDGSDTLVFRAPDTFAVQRSVRVVMDGAPLRSINELECANGSVYANVWHRTFIVRIDPATGLVLEKIDAAGLLTESEAAGADVLNGIAYDPADGVFYITGKRWPKLFKVRFVPASA